MTYNADSIKVLEGLEAVRLRPGMYIGSTGVKGLHHLISEIVDNSVDEHLAGYCDEIIVTLKKDGSISVEDNGRGIPIDKHSSGKSALRIIMTTLHAGGKFEGNAISGGLHGVGAAVVNALCTDFSVEVYKNGKKYRDEYRFGKAITELKNGELEAIGNTNKTGTKINFSPDPEIFESTIFKEDLILKRLKELSYLNKNLKLIFVNENNNNKVVYKHEDGLRAFMKDINENKDTITDIIEFSGKKDNVEIDVVIQYTDDSSESIYSFCNNINTHEGGTHVSGLRTSFTRTINQYARELGTLKKNDDNFEGRDVRSGMVAIISIKYPQPEFEGQTKTKLGNPEARGIVDEITSMKLQLYFDRNLETLEKIIDKAARSVKLRKAEEKVRDNIMNKTTTLTVNKKLASCKTRKPEKAELFIVEGDSAGGSAKQGRNRDFQAILPLKGKILNVEKQTLDRVLNNVEVTTLISALGTGIGSNFDINKLKYHKVILMTDADVDGAHINTLLLTLFYRYMPQLIKDEYIYIAMPPLYKVTIGTGSNKKEEYLYNDLELSEFLDKQKTSKIKIQRYKGLGEMNPEQLWETTLNPKTRVLKKVLIEDAIEADKITSMLMGSKVPPRRKFIYEEAQKANLDI